MSEQQEESSLGGHLEGLAPEDHLHESVLAVISEESLVDVDTTAAAGLEETDQIVMLLGFLHQQSEKVDHRTEGSEDDLVESEHDYGSEMVLQHVSDDTTNR